MTTQNKPARLLWPLLLALSACGSCPPQPMQPTRPSPSAELMRQRPPSFAERIEMILSRSAKKPTTSPEPSPRSSSESAK